MAFVYKRGKIYYVGYRVTVLDKDGNKIRKQVCQPISPDKRVAEEFAAKKMLDVYADKNRLLKRDVRIQQFYDEYKKNYSIKKKRSRTIYCDDSIWQKFKKTCPEVITTKQSVRDTVSLTLASLTLSLTLASLMLSLTLCL